MFVRILTKILEGDQVLVQRFFSKILRRSLTILKYRFKDVERVFMKGSLQYLYKIFSGFKGKSLNVTETSVILGKVLG